MRYLGTLAVLVSCGLACGAPGPPAEPGDQPALLPAWSRVATLEVVPDAARLSADERELLARGEVASRIRQGALDALEQLRRFDPNGDVSVRVRLVEVHLRSWLGAVLLADRAGPDRLASTLEVRRPGEPIAAIRVEATTSLGGWEWRDPGRRLDRLARELARRISERL